MPTSFRIAAALLASVAALLTGCTKSSDQTTTSTSSQSASEAQPSPADSAGAEAQAAAPADTSSAAAAPADTSSPGASSAMSAASPSVSATLTAGTNGTSSGGYITLPVYPGATETKGAALSMSSESGSVAMKIYTTKDDTKKVAEWYRAHLPASFKGGILTSGDKTVGTVTDEHPDGDQNVVVSGDNGTTRMQLTTKHGK